VKVTPSTFGAKKPIQVTNLTGTPTLTLNQNKCHHDDEPVPDTKVKDAVDIESMNGLEKKKPAHSLLHRLASSPADSLNRVAAMGERPLCA
jgi:hypothetical protein